MAIISRRQYDHPALATAGGSALHASISNLYTVLGDDSMSRYKTFTAVANSSVGVIAHEFGLDFANLKVQIFTGTYPALTLVSDPIGSGWTVAATSGLASRSIDVTAPASGGPHTYAVLVSHESNASQYIPGLVSIGAQTFAGAKTYLDPLIGSDTTDSSSYTTGAFKTAGGMGIAKKLYVGTDAFIGNAGAASNALVITNNGYITSSTSDGTDDKSMTIAGGGGGTTWNQNRGAGIIFKGNDVGGANLDGEIQYYAGNSGVANGRHRFIAGGVDIAIGAQTGAWTLGFAGHTGAQTAYGSHFDLISATSLASTYIKLTNSDFTKQSFIGQETSTVANSFVTGAPAYSLGIAANNGIYFSGSASTLHGFMTSAGAWTFPANIASTSTTTGTVIVTGGMGVSGKAYHGDNIVMSDGKGIDFAAFTDGSVDGTATSQVLNDYEEGTWTPAYTSSGGGAASYSLQSGSYTKVGRLVTVFFRLVVNGVGTLAAGTLRLTGLPFTMSTTGSIFPTQIVAAESLGTAANYVVIQHNHNQAYADVIYSASASTSSGYVSATTANYITAATQINGQYSYFV